MFIRHPPSVETSRSAPDSVTARHLSSTIASEMALIFTEKVPPNPQHSSASARGSTSTRASWASSACGASRTPISRSRWQEG